MAGPIILGDITQIALGFIDSVMVGAIHSTRLAAASLVMNVLAIPYVMGIGVTFSISPLVARSRGQGHYGRPAHILFNGFVLCGIVAFLLALLIHLNAGIVFHLGQDPVVAQLARPYLIVMGWSTLPMLLFLGLKQFSDALEYTRVGMVISLSAIPVNFCLNWILIYGHFGMPRYELLGAGIGTLISRCLVLVALLLVIVRHRVFADYRRRWTSTARLRWKTMKALIRIGIPSSLQYGMEAGAFAFSGIMIGWLGATQQAAHQIAISLATLTYHVSLGFSAAGAIRVAHAYGQKDQAALRKIGYSTLRISFLWGALCALMFILLKSRLPFLFNDEAPVVAAASVLLVIAAVFQVSDSMQAVSVGLLRGLHDVRMPTFLVVIAYWVIGLPVGYWLAFPLHLQSAGIWIGLTIGLTASATLLGFRFSRSVQKKV